MLCLFVALTSSVPSEGRGCCHLWVRDAIGCDFKFVSVCGAWCGCGTVWVAGRHDCITVFPEVKGWERYHGLLVVLTGGENWVAVYSLGRDRQLNSEVCKMGLRRMGGAALCALSVAVAALSSGARCLVFFVISWNCQCIFFPYRFWSFWSFRSSPHPRGDHLAGLCCMRGCIPLKNRLP